MNHLILTRLAIGNPSEAWLRSRMKFFENYCAPSISLQSCKNFEWLLAISQNTPKWFIERALEASPNAKLIYTNCSGIYPDWTKIIPEQLISKPLLTTRFDSDDMLHKDFIKYLQNEAKKQKYPSVLDAPHGYKLNLNSLDCYQYTLESNHFISLIEYDTFKTVNCSDHMKISNKFRIIKFCSNKRLWVQGIHGGNVINGIGGYEDDWVNWDDLKKDFIGTD